MKCNKCGYEMKEKQKKCPKCGYKINDKKDPNYFAIGMGSALAATGSMKGISLLSKKVSEDKLSSNINKNIEDLPTEIETLNESPSESTIADNVDIDNNQDIETIELQSNEPANVNTTKNNKLNDYLNIMNGKKSNESSTPISNTGTYDIENNELKSFDRFLSGVKNYDNDITTDNESTTTTNESTNNDTQTSYSNEELQELLKEYLVENGITESITEEELDELLDAYLSSETITTNEISDDNVCICTTKCSENSINSLCPVCLKKYENCTALEEETTQSSNFNNNYSNPNSNYSDESEGGGSGGSSGGSGSSSSGGSGDNISYAASALNGLLSIFGSGESTYDLKSFEDCSSGEYTCDTFASQTSATLDLINNSGTISEVNIDSSEVSISSSIYKDISTSGASSYTNTIQTFLSGGNFSVNDDGTTSGTCTTISDMMKLLEYNKNALYEDQTAFEEAVKQSEIERPDLIAYMYESSISTDSSGNQYIDIYDADTNKLSSRYYLQEDGTYIEQNADSEGNLTGSGKTLTATEVFSKMVDVSDVIDYYGSVANAKEENGKYKVAGVEYTEDEYSTLHSKYAAATLTLLGCGLLTNDQQLSSSDSKTGVTSMEFCEKEEEYIQQRNGNESREGNDAIYEKNMVNYVIGNTSLINSQYGEWCQTFEKYIGDCIKSDNYASEYWTNVASIVYNKNPELLHITMGSEEEISRAQAIIEKYDDEIVDEFIQLFNLNLSEVMTEYSEKNIEFTDEEFRKFLVEEYGCTEEAVANYSLDDFCSSTTDTEVSAGLKLSDEINACNSVNYNTKLFKEFYNENYETISFKNSNYGFEKLIDSTLDSEFTMDDYNNAISNGILFDSTITEIKSSYNTYLNSKEDDAAILATGTDYSNDLRSYYMYKYIEAKENYLYDEYKLENSRSLDENGNVVAATNSSELYSAYNASYVNYEIAQEENMACNTILMPLYSTIISKEIIEGKEQNLSEETIAKNIRELNCYNAFEDIKLAGETYKSDAITDVTNINYDGISSAQETYHNTIEDKALYSKILDDIEKYNDYATENGYELLPSTLYDSIFENSYIDYFIKVSDNIKTSMKYMKDSMDAVYATNLYILKNNQNISLENYETNYLSKLHDSIESTPLDELSDSQKVSFFWEDVYSKKLGTEEKENLLANLCNDLAEIYGEDSEMYKYITDKFLLDNEEELTNILDGYGVADVNSNSIDGVETASKGFWSTLLEGLKIKFTDEKQDITPILNAEKSIELLMNYYSVLEEDSIIEKLTYQYLYGNTFDFDEETKRKVSDINVNTLSNALTNSYLSDNYLKCKLSEYAPEGFKSEYANMSIEEIEKDIISDIGSIGTYVNEYNEKYNENLSLYELSRIAHQAENMNSPYVEENSEKDKDYNKIVEEILKTGMYDSCYDAVDLYNTCKDLSTSYQLLEQSYTSNTNLILSQLSKEIVKSGMYAELNSKYETNKYKVEVRNESYNPDALDIQTDVIYLTCYKTDSDGNEVKTNVDLNSYDAILYFASHPDELIEYFNPENDYTSGISSNIYTDMYNLVTAYNSGKFSDGSKKFTFTENYDEVIGLLNYSIMSGGTSSYLATSILESVMTSASDYTSYLNSVNIRKSLSNDDEITIGLKTYSVEDGYFTCDGEKLQFYDSNGQNGKIVSASDIEKYVDEDGNIHLIDITTQKELYDENGKNISSYDTSPTFWDGAGDWWAIKGYALADGLTQWSNGNSNIFGGADGIKDSYDYKVQLINEYLTKNYGTAFAGNYGIYSSIGNMLPSIISTLAVAGIGGSIGIGKSALKLASFATSIGTMGVSAAGNYVEENLQNGMTYAQAYTSGILSGAAEVVLESALGSVPGVSQVEALEKIGGIKALIPKMLSEGLEESVQDYFNEFTSSLVTGSEADLEVTGQQAIESFIYGAITGGILSIPGIAVDTISTVTLNNKYAISTATSVATNNGNILTLLISEDAQTKFKNIMNEFSNNNSKIDSLVEEYKNSSEIIAEYESRESEDALLSFDDYCLMKVSENIANNSITKAEAATGKENAINNQKAQNFQSKAKTADEAAAIASYSKVINLFDEASKMTIDSQTKIKDEISKLSKKELEIFLESATDNFLNENYVAEGILSAVTSEINSSTESNSKNVLSKEEFNRLLDRLSNENIQLNSELIDSYIVERYTETYELIEMESKLSSRFTNNENIFKKLVSKVKDLFSEKETTVSQSELLSEMQKIRIQDNQLIEEINKNNEKIKNTSNQDEIIRYTNENIAKTNVYKENQTKYKSLEEQLINKYNNSKEYVEKFREKHKDLVDEITSLKEKLNSGILSSEEYLKTQDKIYSLQSEVREITNQYINSQNEVEIYNNYNENILASSEGIVSIVTQVVGGTVVSGAPILNYINGLKSQIDGLKIQKENIRQNIKDTNGQKIENILNTMVESKIDSQIEELENLEKGLVELITKYNIDQNSSIDELRNVLSIEQNNALDELNTQLEDISKILEEFAKEVEENVNYGENEKSNIKGIIDKIKQQLDFAKTETNITYKQILVKSIQNMINSINNNEVLQKLSETEQVNIELISTKKIEITRVFNNLQQQLNNINKNINESFKETFNNLNKNLETLKEQLSKSTSLEQIESIKLEIKSLEAKIKELNNNNLKITLKEKLDGRIAALKNKVTVIDNKINQSIKDLLNKYTNLKEKFNNSQTQSELTNIEEELEIIEDELVDFEIDFMKKDLNGTIGEKIFKLKKSNPEFSSKLKDIQNRVQQATTKEELTQLRNEYVKEIRNDQVFDEIIEEFDANMNNIVKNFESKTTSIKDTNTINEEIEQNTEVKEKSSNNQESINENIDTALNLMKENAEVIDVNELAKSQVESNNVIEEHEKPYNMFEYYKEYDYVFKVNGSLESVIKTINENNIKGNLLIEIDNLTQLDSNLISQIPSNVKVRIGTLESKYTVGRATNSLTADLKGWTYTAEELEQIVKAKNEIFSGITEEMNDYEKAKYIYDYLSKNIKYEANPGYEITRSKQFIGLNLLIEQEGTCLSFAHTYKTLLSTLGIKCEEVSGKLSGARGGHAYNIVTIGENTFIVDTTRTSLNNRQGTGFAVENISEYRTKSTYNDLTSKINSTYRNISNNLNDNLLETYEGELVNNETDNTELETIEGEVVDYQKDVARNNLNKEINKQIQKLKGKQAEKLKDIQNRLSKSNTMESIETLRNEFAEELSKIKNNRAKELQNTRSNNSLKEGIKQTKESIINWLNNQFGTKELDTVVGEVVDFQRDVAVNDLTNEINRDIKRISGKQGALVSKLNNIKERLNNTQSLNEVNELRNEYLKAIDNSIMKRAKNTQTAKVNQEQNIKSNSARNIVIGKVSSYKSFISRLSDPMKNNSKIATLLDSMYNNKYNKTKDYDKIVTSINGENGVIRTLATPQEEARHNRIFNRENYYKKYNRNISLKYQSGGYFYSKIKGDIKEFFNHFETEYGYKHDRISFEHINTFSTDVEITDRLYLNLLNFSDVYKFTEEFAEACEQNGLEFYLKIGYSSQYTESMSPSTMIRDESVVIYSPQNMVTSYAKIANEILKSHPEFQIGEPPVLTAKINNFIGYGSEPIGKGKSFNSQRQNIVFYAMTNAENIYKSQYGALDTSNIKENTRFIEIFKEQYAKVSQSYGLSKYNSVLNNNVDYILEETQSRQKITIIDNETVISNIETEPAFSIIVVKLAAGNIEYLKEALSNNSFCRISLNTIIETIKECQNKGINFRITNEMKQVIEAYDNNMLTEKFRKDYVSQLEANETLDTQNYINEKSQKNEINHDNEASIDLTIKQKALIKTLNVLLPGINIDDTQLHRILNNISYDEILEINKLNSLIRYIKNMEKGIYDKTLGLAEINKQMVEMGISSIEELTIKYGEKISNLLEYCYNYEFMIDNVNVKYYGNLEYFEQYREQFTKIYKNLPLHMKQNLYDVNIFEKTFNPYDYYWSITRKGTITGFTSSATGGMGTINFWNVSDENHVIINEERIYHEMGHVLDSKLGNGEYWTQKSQDWQKAIKSDRKSVSNYGNTDILEDFAESVSRFYNDNENFKNDCPNRYKTLSKIIQQQESNTLPQKNTITKPDVIRINDMGNTELLAPYSKTTIRLESNSRSLKEMLENMKDKNRNGRYYYDKIRKRIDDSNFSEADKEKFKDNLENFCIFLNDVNQFVQDDRFLLRVLKSLDKSGAIEINEKIIANLNWSKAKNNGANILIYELDNVLNIFDLYKNIFELSNFIKDKNHFLSSPIQIGGIDFTLEIKQSNDLKNCGTIKLDGEEHNYPGFTFTIKFDISKLDNGEKITLVKPTMSYDIKHERMLNHGEMYLQKVKSGTKYILVDYYNEATNSKGKYFVELETLKDTEYEDLYNALTNVNVNITQQNVKFFNQYFRFVQNLGIDPIKAKSSNMVIVEVKNDGLIEMVSTNAPIFGGQGGLKQSNLFIKSVVNDKGIVFKNRELKYNYSAISTEFNKLYNDGFLEVVSEYDIDFGDTFEIKTEEIDLPSLSSTSGIYGDLTK